MLFASEMICNGKEVWQWRAQYFKSPSLAIASQTRDVYVRRCTVLKKCPSELRILFLSPTY